MNAMYSPHGYAPNGFPMNPMYYLNGCAPPINPMYPPGYAPNGFPMGPPPAPMQAPVRQESILERQMEASLTPLMNNTFVPVGSFHQGQTQVPPTPSMNNTFVSVGPVFQGQTQVPPIPSMNNTYATVAAPQMAMADPVYESQDRAAHVHPNPPQGATSASIERNNTPSNVSVNGREEFKSQCAHPRTTTRGPAPSQGKSSKRSKSQRAHPRTKTRGATPSQRELSCSAPGNKAPANREKSQRLPPQPYLTDSEMEQIHSSIEHGSQQRTPQTVLPVAQRIGRSGLTIQMIQDGPAAVNDHIKTNISVGMAQKSSVTMRADELQNPPSQDTPSPWSCEVIAPVSSSPRSDHPGSCTLMEQLWRPAPPLKTMNMDEMGHVVREGKSLDPWLDELMESDIWKHKPPGQDMDIRTQKPRLAISLQQIEIEMTDFDKYNAKMGGNFVDEEEVSQMLARKQKLADIRNLYSTLMEEERLIAQKRKKGFTASRVSPKKAAAKQAKDNVYKVRK